jgi:hypothetical protein
LTTPSPGDGGGEEALMRRLLLLAALAATFGLTTTVNGAPKPGSGAGEAAPAPPGGVSHTAGAVHRPIGAVKLYEAGKAKPHLTSGECKQLGGDVYEQSGCDSGSACLAIDQRGGEHWVCLTKE